MKKPQLIIITKDKCMLHTNDECTKYTNDNIAQIITSIKNSWDSICLLTSDEKLKTDQGLMITPYFNERSEMTSLHIKKANVK